ncbi:MAG: hypothetical protein QOD77_1063 [Thermoplasmata archaeon]|nr:hypothetical protein [Thermoplasmata archaeon]
MKLSTLVWGLAWLVAGLAVAFGWVPGADGWAQGPRYGIAALLLVLGVVLIVGANAAWTLRRTAREDGAGGGCPVGATCACGHFNLKPRRACKACGAATSFP